MKLYALVAACLVAACFGQRPVPSSADTEARLKRIEEYLAKNREAIEFLSKVYEAQASREVDEPAEDVVFAVPIADDVRLGQVEGPATAAVTIVKAFDFACPHCARTSPLLSELVQQYGGKVRVVFKNMIVHDIAMPAHLASCAAAKQGKYLAFKAAFWDKGFAAWAASQGADARQLGADRMVELARDLGLDAVRFKTDMDGAACKDFIRADMAELAKFKVTGTPTFWINGIEIPGALPKAELQQIIDARLKIAEASGVPSAQYYDREVLGKGAKAFVSKKDAARK